MMHLPLIIIDVFKVNIYLLALGLTSGVIHLLFLSYLNPYTIQNYFES